jgi:hypothetical protein
MPPDASARANFPPAYGMQAAIRNRAPGRGDAMRQLTFRLPTALIGRLDTMAKRDGTTRTQIVRRILEAGTSGEAAPPASEPPSEDELLDLLGESARNGNVAAIRSLLIRTEADPQRQALAALEALAQDRRQ